MGTSELVVFVPMGRLASLTRCGRFSRKGSTGREEFQLSLKHCNVKRNRWNLPRLQDMYGSSNESLASTDQHIAALEIR